MVQEFSVGQEAYVKERYDQVRDWVPPAKNSIKVNVDAGVSSHGTANVGGLIRDEDDLFVGVFHKVIGIASVITAELWAMLHGLGFAWDRGWRCVELETDSKEALDAILAQGLDHPDYNLIARINQVLGRNWRFICRWVSREGNNCVDGVVKLGLHGTGDLVVFEEPPSAIQPSLDMECATFRASRLLVT